MFHILVASAKGGVGKSTISTTLAGYYATRGRTVALVDADPQGSALSWCGRRVAPGAEVWAVDGTRRNWARQIPAEASHVVIDAPAGAMPKSLGGFIEAADAIVVPILPSVLDMEATVRFLDALADVPRVARGQVATGLVANRLKPWTHASQQALAQMADWPCELVAQLRDTQAYVLLAGLGKCMFDYSAASVRAHQEDWKPLLRWLERVHKRS